MCIKINWSFSIINIITEIEKFAINARFILQKLYDLRLGSSFISHIKKCLFFITN